MGMMMTDTLMITNGGYGGAPMYGNGGIPDPYSQPAYGAGTSKIYVLYYCSFRKRSLIIFLINGD